MFTQSAPLDNKEVALQCCADSESEKLHSSLLSSHFMAATAGIPPTCCMIGK